MIKAYKAIGVLVNTLVMCGLTLALIHTNWNSARSSALALGVIMIITGNAILAAAYINNTVEDK